MTTSMKMVVFWDVPLCSLIMTDTLGELASIIKVMNKLQPVMYLLSDLLNRTPCLSRLETLTGNKVCI
jgi:hypothetical protein